MRKAGTGTRKETAGASPRFASVLPAGAWLPEQQGASMACALQILDRKKVGRVGNPPARSERFEHEIGGLSAKPGRVTNPPYKKPKTHFHLFPGAAKRHEGLTPETQ